MAGKTNKKRPAAKGVSVTFFCSAVRVLDKQLGQRLCGKSDTFERFRSHLADAEATYAELPPAPKRDSKKETPWPPST